MATGKVKWFCGKKGYGFIETGNEEGPNKDAFVHYSDIAFDGYKILSEGQFVEYEPFEGERGLQAKKVTLIENNPPQS